MDYEIGKPEFSVEKPKKIIWGNEMLDYIQDTERFIGEFKIDEHRGMLCIDKNNDIKHFSYRGGQYEVDEELIETIRSLNIPKCTVIDSGFLKLKKLGQNPYLYAFDILVLEGHKVRKTLKERLEIRNSLFETKGRLLMPLEVKEFVKEFELLMKGESDLAKETAKLYGIEHELLLPLIEGFVIKDLDGKHSFPSSVKKSNSFYKLRLEDVPKGK